MSLKSTNSVDVDVNTFRQYFSSLKRNEFFSLSDHAQLIMGMGEEKTALTCRHACWHTITRTQCARVFASCWPHVKVNSEYGVRNLQSMITAKEQSIIFREQLLRIRRQFVGSKRGENVSIEF